MSLQDVLAHIRKLEADRADELNGRGRYLLVCCRRAVEKDLSR